MSRYMAVLGLVTPQIVNLKRFLCDRLLFASNARISSPGGPSDANSSNNRTQRPLWCVDIGARELGCWRAAWKYCFVCA